MLNPKNIEAALGLAHVWAEQGRMARPKPGTPIAELNQAIFSGIEIRGIHGDSVAEWDKDPSQYTRNILQAASTDVASIQHSNREVAERIHSMSEHTRQLVTCKEKIIEGLRGQVFTARNVVAPIVNEFATRIHEALIQLTNQTMSGLDVVIVDIPDFARDGRFEAGIRDYADRRYTPSSESPGMPELNTTELIEFLRTGMADMDGQIMDFIRVQGMERIQQVYDWTFKGRQFMSGTETKPKGLGDDMVNRLLSDTSYGMVNSLIMYLLSLNFYDNPIEGTKANLDTYNSRIAVIRSNAAHRLNAHLSMFRSAKERGQLVALYTDKSVMVFKDQYDAFLENKGTTDMVLGSLLVSNRPFMTAQFLERAQELQSAWERQVASNKIDAVSYRVSTMKRMAMELSTEWMQGKEFAIDVITSRNRQLAALLANMRPVEFETIPEFALSVVCDIHFPKSSAKHILNQINQIGKENPDIDPSNLATVAYLDYLIDWVCSQIEVVDAK